LKLYRHEASRGLFATAELLEVLVYFLCHCKPKTHFKSWIYVYVNMNLVILRSWSS